MAPGAAAVIRATRPATSPIPIAQRRLTVPARKGSLRESHQDGHGAVIFEGVGSDAPDDVVVGLRAVDGHGVIGAEAGAFVADARPAAIPISNQVRPLIGR